MYAGSSPDCTHRNAHFFIQFMCVHSTDSLSLRYFHGTLIGSVAIFTSFLVLIMIYFLRRKLALDQIEWDVQTVTPGDYTVQIPISEEQYMEYKLMNSESESNISLGFKVYLKQWLEKLLSKEKYGDLEIDSKINVADIQIAFKNRKIIDLLRKRGESI